MILPNKDIRSAASAPARGEARSLAEPQPCQTAGVQRRAAGSGLRDRVTNKARMLLQTKTLQKYRPINKSGGRVRSRRTPTWSSTWCCSEDPGPRCIAPDDRPLGDEAGMSCRINGNPIETHATINKLGQQIGTANCDLPTSGAYDVPRGVSSLMSCNVSSLTKSDSVFEAPEARNNIAQSLP